MKKELVDNKGFSQLEIQSMYDAQEEFRVTELNKAARRAKTDGTFTLSLKAKAFILEGNAMVGNYGCDAEEGITFLPYSWKSESGLYKIFINNIDSSITITEMNFLDACIMTRSNLMGDALDYLIGYTCSIITFESESENILIKPVNFLKELVQLRKICVFKNPNTINNFQN